MSPAFSMTTPDAARYYQPLVVVLAAASAGIILDRSLGLPLAAWLVAVAVAWVGWMLLWRRRRARLAMVPLLVAVLGAAGALHHFRWNLFDEYDIGVFARQTAEPVCVEAIALSGPRRVPAPPENKTRAIPVGDRTRVPLEVRAIRDRDAWRMATGRATLTVDGHLVGVRAGDRLRVFGQVNRVHPPDNPGGFDFAAYARSDGELAVIWCDYPDGAVQVDRAGGWSLRGWLDGLRSRGDQLLWRYLDPSRSGLAAAMFLGLREELDPDQSQAFLETGTVHLLVISGLNVAILASCVLFVLRFGPLPRWASFLVVAVFTILYAVVTDAQPPVVRATIMVLVVCAAYSLGRQALGLNTIALAAIIVLVLNPAELFRAGTQLSFLSVMAMSWTGFPGIRPRTVDPLTLLIAQTRPWPIRVTRNFGREVWQLTLTTTLIWIIVLPLVMSRFHLVSPAAIVLGPLLALPVAVAMAAGFGVLIFGWWIGPLGSVFGWLCDGSLWILERSVAVAQRIPGSHFWVAGPGDWWLVGFYVALALWAAFPKWRPPRRWCLATAMGWSSLGLGVAAWNARPQERLECTFMSVGHGCSVLVELPGGEKVLYDAGRLGSPITPARSIALCLWSKGITHLDAIVISHADADHYNAIPKLLEQFSVGAIYVSPVMFDDMPDAVRVLYNAVQKSGVPLRPVWGGDHLRTSGPCAIEVLHPPKEGVLGSDNANSVVLAIEYAGRRLLLTGDLEPPGLHDVLAELPRDVDVLLAPHHGSQRSDPPGMAAWSQPEYVVVSSGEGDDIQLVMRAYAAYGGQVLPTSTKGAVMIVVRPKEFAVDWWRRTDYRWVLAQ